MANYPIDVGASGQPVQWSTAGGTSPLESILNNRLLLQYLSAAGQDIGAGRPIGANVNAVTQQNISAQSYAKLLQKLLAQGGDVKMNKDKVTINAPPAAFQGGGQPSTSSITEPYTGQQLTQQQMGQLQPIPTYNPNQPVKSDQSNNNLLSQLLIGGPTENPPVSSLGNLTGADLAGLRPEDISQALQFKFVQDTEQRRDALATMRDSIEQQKLALEYAKLNKDTDTADIRNYQYAVKQGYTGSFEEFRNSTDTAGIKEYERAKAEGYDGTFQQWKFELAERSRSQINIGDKVEQKKALAGVEGQLHFTTGKFAKDVEDFKKSDEYSKLSWAASLGDKNKAKAATAAVGNYVQNLIETHGGDVQKVEWDKDDKTAIWTVRWPGGDVTKVRYRVRD